MKTRIFSLSAVLLCLFLLSGCVIVKENLSFDPGGISKAQRIEVAGASDGQLLGTLDTEEDIDAFVESVFIETWKLSELPAGLEREGLRPALPCRWYRLQSGDQTGGHPHYASGGQRLH